MSGYAPETGYNMGLEAAQVQVIRPKSEVFLDSATLPLPFT